MSTTAIHADGFAQATAADDADVRALLRQSVMPGAATLAFTREPQYFAGEGLAGAHDHTVVHRRDGRLNGVARLSMQTLHRDGRAVRLGYLSELRIAPDAAHAAQMLRDGYACLRELVHAHDLDACFTSIAMDNSRARRVLEHGHRFGLPRYEPLADLVTLLLPVRRSRLTARVTSAAASASELTAFLQEQARAAQLTLTWDAERFRQLAQHGMTLADFRVVRAGGDSGRIVAAGAVWDQRAFKQTVVVQFSGALRVSRPLINTLAMAGIVPSLPTPGQILAQGALFGLAAPAHVSALLRVLEADAAQRGLDWLVVARETRDPQLAMLRAAARDMARLRVAPREYHTRLYDVCWPDASPRGLWGMMPFRPEVALL